MKNIVSKLILASLFILCSYQVQAQNLAMDNIQVLARIHSIKQAEALTGYPIHLEDQALSDVLRNLEPDDEVILTGSIVYRPVTQDNKTAMNPTFHIKSIKPVSLQRLGKIDLRVSESNMVFSGPVSPTGAKSLPISAEIASALTMTASILMLHDLSGQNQTQPLKSSMEKGVIFSAGALATGLFIWEQLKSK